MNTEDTMVNEEVMNVAKVIYDNPKNNLYFAGGIGLVVLGSLLVFKHVVKPALAKHKEKKESVNKKALKIELITGDSDEEFTDQ